MNFNCQMDTPNLANRRAPPLRQKYASEDSVRRGDVNVETLRLVKSVLLSRAGSVLRRQTILKCDHFPQAVASHKGIQLLDAPNFRMLKCNVYGTAQPTSLGLSTIMGVLGLSQEVKCAHWISTREEPVIYINGKPYVLRDIEDPLKNLKGLTGISASRLEQMETRLRDDVLKESTKYNGLLLVHDEINKNQVIPRWVAAELVQTPREVVSAFQNAGHKLKYTRLPAGPEQAPEGQFLDDLSDIICTSPLHEAILVSCGMGGGRTTVGTVIAVMIRSRLEQNEETNSASTTSLLRVMYLLEKGLRNEAAMSVVEWAIARGGLMGQLIMAVQGNYALVQGLVKVLDAEGMRGYKIMLDNIIDHCDAVVNLREEILLNRIRHSAEKGTEQDIRKAVFSLERYFILIAFAAFSKSDDFRKQSFTKWLQQRAEITRMSQYIYSRQIKLQLFRPIDDLSELAGQEQGNVGEVEAYVLSNRNGALLTSGTLIKSDLYVDGEMIHGLKNYRQIPGCQIYAVAQPTNEGFLEIKEMISGQLVWINLREEPLIYILGTPHMLRDQYTADDQIKSFGGISAERLELLEKRLREDVCEEMIKYQNQILVHGKLHIEKGEHTLLASWLNVTPEQVSTVKETVQKLGIQYYRVPVTSQHPPEEDDFDVMLQIVVKYPQDTPIVVNCQAGLGRSTTGTVILWLVRNWILGSKKREWAQRALDGQTNVSSFNLDCEETVTYKCIHSLLRVIKDGLKAKELVDKALSLCGKHLHIRQAIEKYEKTRALLNLSRYFLLIAFQAYLIETPPTSTQTNLETFKSWMKRHQEVQRMYLELIKSEDDPVAMMDALTSVEKQVIGDGIALTSEIARVVQERCGAVLARLTILKSDAFIGCQKLSLPERIEGASNFRFIPFKLVRQALFNALHLPFSQDNDLEYGVCGVAMPTTVGIENVLLRLKQKVLWICLREEPVLYINQRPFVLRLFQEPLRNLETTGIARERVEQMELNMKEDALLELARYNGRILLHDEEITKKGFEIVPLWESATDILTPLDVFTKHQNVEYLRIPITDEQAPIPLVFDELVENTSKNSTFVFNCQMGRGRTTTGMVITCIIHGVLLTKHPFFSDGEGGLGYADWDGTFDFLDDEERLSSLENLEFSEEAMVKRYKRGEYQIILRLVAVLNHGKMAKVVADTCIDVCSDMQNLRKEIYSFKVRLESLTPNTAKYKVCRQVGINYLVRYFYLIAFAGYLLDKVTQNLKQKFSEWLKERREITAIINSDSQDFA